MKKRLCFLLLAGGLNFFCVAEDIAGDVPGNEKGDLSYALGMAIASDLKPMGLELNYDAFTRGLREFSESENTRFTLDEAIERVETALQAAMAEKAEQNRQKETTFLTENAALPGIYTTATGLQYEIIAEGTGRQPGVSDLVSVHYRGYLPDGTVFDSSLERGQPAEFPLEGVIPGWSEGIQLMREGGKSRLFIPSKLAYGNRGAGNVIPPNTPLIFEVELLEILDESPQVFPEGGAEVNPETEDSTTSP